MISLFGQVCATAERIVSAIHSCALYAGMSTDTRGIRAHVQGMRRERAARWTRPESGERAASTSYVSVKGASTVVRRTGRAGLCASTDAQVAPSSLTTALTVRSRIRRSVVSEQMRV